jgi:hypothetical protein
MILVFDTYSGLCNQFYDINCGVNFCIINNLKFTFRFSSFREKNLTNWYNTKFENLFDTTFLEKYKHLYIEFNKLQLTNENTYNFNGLRAIELFTDNYLNEILNIKKQFIVLKQFWAIYKFTNIVDDLNKYILPSKKLIQVYNSIKSKLLKYNEEYNFIHYRYEHDFTSHFNCQIEQLKPLVLKLKHHFKNTHLKIYIATSNIKDIVDLNDPDLCNVIITKNEDDLKHYNFEELAFIDYMFGIKSNEIFGHSNSSFSCMLNNLKTTENYYNKIIDNGQIKHIFTEKYEPIRDIDWTYYLDRYHDLRANGVHTEQQAKKHWLEYGKKEGRVALNIPNFDWTYYLDRYHDLRANGVHTEQQAKKHWIVYGQREGRVAFDIPNFDWIYYLERYHDLRANGVHTEQQAKKHWLEYGQQEGRIYNNQ